MGLFDWVRGGGGETARVQEALELLRQITAWMHGHAREVGPVIATHDDFGRQASATAFQDRSRQVSQASGGSRRLFYDGFGLEDAKSLLEALDGNVKSDADSYLSALEVLLLGFYVSEATYRELEPHYSELVAIVRQHLEAHPRLLTAAAARVLKSLTRDLGTAGLKELARSLKDSLEAAEAKATEKAREAAAKAKVTPSAKEDPPAEPVGRAEAAPPAAPATESRPAGPRADPPPPQPTPAGPVFSAAPAPAPDARDAGTLAAAAAAACGTAAAATGSIDEQLLAAASSQAMTRVRLFELISDEVFRDGKIQDDENAVLVKMAAFLRLSSDEAKAIARQSLNRYRSGLLGSARPLDGRILYAKALQMAREDGHVDEREARMLDGLRKLFGISDELHQRIAARVNAT